MVRPCRLITRHRSHMGLTEARTFISSTLSVGDSTASEVVGRQLHFHLVAREDPDVVLPHLPGDLRQDLVPVVQLDAEHRARKGLGDLAFDLDLVFLLRQLPRRNRASSARFVGTRENTARAAVRHGSKGVPSGRPAPLFLHDLTVELDPAAPVQVLDDVPVDLADVRAARLGQPVTKRQMDGAVDLLVESGVL